MSKKNLSLCLWILCVFLSRDSTPLSSRRGGGGEASSYLTNINYGFLNKKHIITLLFCNFAEIFGVKSPNCL